MSSPIKLCSHPNGVRVGVCSFRKGVVMSSSITACTLPS